MHSEELSREEYEARKHAGELGNWDVTYLPNGRIQRKQIIVKSRREILLRIKELFSGFLGESFNAKE